MTWVEHTLHGAVIHGVILSWFSVSPEIALATGAVAGMAPDAIEWAAGKLGYDRWKIKMETHFGLTALLGCILPGYWFHVAVIDPIFHAVDASYKRLWLLVGVLDGGALGFALWWWVL